MKQELLNQLKLFLTLGAVEPVKMTRSRFVLEMSAKIQKHFLETVK